jgi:hypothetical protein
VGGAQCSAVGYGAIHGLGGWGERVSSRTCGVPETDGGITGDTRWAWCSCAQLQLCGWVGPHADRRKGAGGTDAACCIPGGGGWGERGVEGSEKARGDRGRVQRGQPVEFYRLPAIPPEPGERWRWALGRLHSYTPVL